MPPRYPSGLFAASQKPLALTEKNGYPPAHGLPLRIPCNPTHPTSRLTRSNRRRLYPRTPAFLH